VGATRPLQTATTLPAPAGRGGTEPNPAGAEPLNNAVLRFPWKPQFALPHPLGL